MSTAQQDQETEPGLDGATAGESDEDVTSAGADLARMLIADPVALLDMFIDVMRRARNAAQLPKEQFHVVVVPDAGEAGVTTVNSIEELMVVLRASRQQGGQAFGFRGDLLLPSQGGHYLVTPWGRFPLFTDDRDNEVDPKGYLGPVPSILRPVPVPVVSNSGNGDDEAMEQSDDEVDDDDVEDDVEEDEDD